MLHDTMMGRLLICCVALVNRRSTLDTKLPPHQQKFDLLRGNFLPAVAEGGEEREKKGRKRGEREKGGGRSSSDGPRSRGLLNAQNSLKIARVGVKRGGKSRGGTAKIKSPFLTRRKRPQNRKIFPYNRYITGVSRPYACRKAVYRMGRPW